MDLLLHLLLRHVSALRPIVLTHDPTGAGLDETRLTVQAQFDAVEALPHFAKPVTHLIDEQLHGPVDLRIDPFQVLLGHHVRAESRFHSAEPLLHRAEVVFPFVVHQAVLLHLHRGGGGRPSNSPEVRAQGNFSSEAYQEADMSSDWEVTESPAVVI